MLAGRVWRVRLVRGEGRGVSDQYGGGREGRGKSPGVEGHGGELGGDALGRAGIRVAGRGGREQHVCNLKCETATVGP